MNITSTRTTRRLPSILLCGSLLLCFAACTKPKFKQLVVSNLNHDSVTVDYSFKSWFSKADPEEVILTLIIPSTHRKYRLESPSILRRNIVSIPDKEIGSEETMYLKVSAKFGSDHWIHDSALLRSSKKYLKVLPIVSFEQGREPTVLFRTTLTRKIYGTPYLSQRVQSITPGYKGLGVVDLYINGSESPETYYASTNSTFSPYLSLKEQDKEQLDLRVRRSFVLGNGLNLNYNTRVWWNNLSWSDNKRTVKWERPSTITMLNNYKHESSVGSFQAKYYSFFCPGNKLGVVTFKEFSGKDGLRVETYSDPDFRYRTNSSERSNVIFNKYVNETVYIKVLNVGTGERGDYKLNTHIVDYQSIEANAMINQIGISIIAWLLDTDANNVSRAMDIANSILNHESIDGSVKRFLVGEFKRQLSEISGGNFVTDIAAEAIPEIARQIYYYY